MRSITVTLGGGILALCAGVVQAVPVMLNDMATQTVAGENFNFSFGGLAPSDGTGGTFVLTGAGDYDGRDDEILSWDMEGQIGAAAVGGFCSTGITAVCTSPNGAGLNGGQGGPFDSVVIGQPLGQATWTRTYTLLPAVLDTLLGDGTIDIFIDLTDEVGLFNPPNFVEVTINYESASVPEPETVALAGLGLLILGFARRRRVI